MENTALFIVPRGSDEWKGNEAGWITASGWAGAAGEIFGTSYVATTDGIFSPKESIEFPKGNKDATTSKKPKKIRKFIPEFLITAYKDFKLKNSKPRVWPVEENKFLKNKNVKFVWERHDLFPGPGHKIAEKLNVPFIISVEALAVWEAKKWGVKRPLWGNWLEKNIEAKSLENADLICCVSQEIKYKVISMGINEDKVLVTPNRVDSLLFNPEVKNSRISEKYNLKGKIVFGWTGSFRNFHGLDSVVKAFKLVKDKTPNAILILVGDGQEFDKIKHLVTELNLEENVIFVGRKKFVKVPDYVSNFDICLVSAKSAEGFHYSPLKLREYLALGKAVIVPNAGDLSSNFGDGKDVLMYKPGEVNDLANKMLLLISNELLKQTLEHNALHWFHAEGSWVHELNRVCEILGIEK
ncbi:glycosyltransferase family 4 protein [Gillisia marina]|uniref:glycosyltransferase family 4 protein n=1 Tax=Gillisia marina TaxID=1167637 RepID=UPI00029A6AF1|nr:glycosyltransferase family 4 protein [Gillisia marina]